MKTHSSFFRRVIYSLVVMSIAFLVVFHTACGQEKTPGVKTRVSPNVKKEILPTSILKLKDLPIGKTSQLRIQTALESNYLVYSFWPDSIRRDYWTGVMVMPDPTEADSRQGLVEFDKVYFDKIGNVKVEKNTKASHRNTSFSGYQSADKSSLSQFINNGVKNIGLIQAVNGNKTNIIIDLNGDRIIDFKLTLDPLDKKINLLLSNTVNAIKFFNDLMSYRNMFCAGNLSSAENIYKQSANSNMPLFGLGADSKSVISLCGSNSGRSGGSGGGKSGARKYDPIVDYCKQYLAHQSKSGSINADPPAGGSNSVETDPNHGDGDNGFGDLLRSGVADIRKSVKDVGRSIQESGQNNGFDTSVGDLIEVATDQVGGFISWGTHFTVMGAFLSAVDGVGEVIDHCDSPMGGGSDGSFSPQGGTSAFWVSYCKSKVGDHAGAPTIAEMEESLKSKECSNPAESKTGIVQNVPDAGGSGGSKAVVKPTYGDPTGRNCFKPKHYETFADLMQGISKRRCKSNERPDENGNCGTSSVSRTFDTNRGKAAIAFGDIVGIHFCDPKICDPTKFGKLQSLPKKPKKPN